MERLKNMGLRRSFFLLSVLCLAGALLLTYGVYQTCARVADRYPTYGVVITSDGMVTSMEVPTPEQGRGRGLLGRVQVPAVLVIPGGGVGLGGCSFFPAGGGGAAFSYPLPGPPAAREVRLAVFVL